MAPSLPRSHATTKVAGHLRTRRAAATPNDRRSSKAAVTSKDATRRGSRHSAARANNTWMGEETRGHLFLAGRRSRPLPGDRLLEHPKWGRLAPPAVQPPCADETLQLPEASPPSAPSCDLRRQCRTEWPCTRPFHSWWCAVSSNDVGIAHGLEQHRGPDKRRRSCVGKRARARGVRQTARRRTSRSAASGPESEPWASQTPTRSRRIPGTRTMARMRSSKVPARPEGSAAR